MMLGGSENMITFLIAFVALMLLLLYSLMCTAGRASRNKDMYLYGFEKGD